MFFQECHSTPDSEKEWKKCWNGQIYFSHGQSNSTGCAIAFSENLDIKIDADKISRDEKGRILILEATYDSKKLLLINLYNANTEKDQLEILSNLCNLLSNHNPDGDFHAYFGVRNENYPMFISFLFDFIPLHSLLGTTQLLFFINSEIKK